MKINIEIDCSPEEARTFLGLPDLRPMQEAVMAKLQAQMLDAVSAAAPEALLRAWMPLVPQTPEQMRDAMAGMFRFFGGAGPGPKPGAPRDEPG
ncbi:DUF6489 family protein [Siccirubricoccus phaeus]|uniref:DUF6489 family protein n=1 Tax=Siccirubricoccus phaeus TaxID=2595053 RepID=UPI0011F3B670|nr:DUF6489 family protein [Siccirubricoccus phaeus]